MDDGQRSEHPPVVRSGHPIAATRRRLLGTIALSGAAHLSCALGLAHAIGPVTATTATALIAVILVTTGIAAWVAARAWRDGLDVATLRAPAMFGLLPPIVSLTLGLALLGASDLAGPGLARGGLEHALLQVVPVLAATTAPGIAIALILEYSLWTVAARTGETDALARRASGGTIADARSEPRLDPPGLAGRLARLVAGLGIATALLILAHLSSPSSTRLAGAGAWVEHSDTWLAALGCAGIMLLAVLAAASAGLSPGRDVAALADRLDAIGWDEASSDPASASASARARPLAAPVRVTSFDAVGELFRNLERLRSQLADDVGTYQRALDRTEAADASKREFLAAVSHELRTPLDAISTDAELLLARTDERGLSDAQAEDVRLILAGGRQLRELIEDILDLSMIESGELELRPASCDLGALIDELVDIHRAQLHGHAVELVAERRGPIPAVVCDRKRVGQVVTNLLSNAIKFTERGHVRVILHHDPVRDWITIAVADTGVGIARDELGQIFDEYKQVGARKRKLRGTGLGLAIARRIAHGHGGSLDVRSELGSGSTFTLGLPRVAIRRPDPMPDEEPAP